jgi:hypothetical protein
MKKLITLLTITLLASCNNPSTTATDDDTMIPPAESSAPLDEADSIIARAQQSAMDLENATNETTAKVTENVEKLTELVKVYETKTKTVKAAKQTVIHDTIYIEKKKNFWGREKVNVSKVTDSTLTEVIDSTLN